MDGWMDGWMDYDMWMYARVKAVTSKQRLMLVALSRQHYEPKVQYVDVNNKLKDNKFFLHPNLSTMAYSLF